jgi:phage-related minor tail protein
MSDYDAADDLDLRVQELETSLGGAAGMAAQFSAELSRVRGGFSAAGTDAARLERSLTGGVSRAIDDVVLDGGRLTDALGTVAQSMVRATWKSAVKPVTNSIGEALTGGMTSLFGSLLPFADGAGFAQGRVMPFANGGVVTGPTTFPMRGGTGLMGEAGPEAIMPLTRGADGKLGVRAQGQGQPVTVVMNINTPDAQSFQRSQSQIAARMSQALGRGARNR